MAVYSAQSALAYLMNRLTSFFHVEYQLDGIRGTTRAVLSGWRPKSADGMPLRSPSKARMTDSAALGAHSSAGRTRAPFFLATRVASPWPRSRPGCSTPEAHPVAPSRRPFVHPSAAAQARAASADGPAAVVAAVVDRARGSDRSRELRTLASLLPPPSPTVSFSRWLLATWLFSFGGWALSLPSIRRRACFSLHLAAFHPQRAYPPSVTNHLSCAIVLIPPLPQTFASPSIRCSPLARFLFVPPPAATHVNARTSRSGVSFNGSPAMGRRKSSTAAFPPSRIKKMMQADEDVGKVATATPVLVRCELSERREWKKSSLALLVAPVGGVCCEASHNGGVR